MVLNGEVLVSSCVSRECHLVQSVHAATRKTLLKIKGFSEVKVEKVKEAIAKCQVGTVSYYIDMIYDV